VLGRPWWPGARTLAHDRFAAEVRKESSAILHDAEACATEHGERWSAGFGAFAPDVAVSGQHFMKLGPWRMVFRDAPGHSSSQLTCHLADLRLLLAADMLSAIEPPLLHGPPSIYRATIETLLPLAEHGAIETLIPGHGPIARDREAVMARFRADLDYLDALERGVETALDAGGLARGHAGIADCHGLQRARISDAAGGQRPPGEHRLRLSGTRGIAGTRAVSLPESRVGVGRNESDARVPPDSAVFFPDAGDDRGPRGSHAGTQAALQADRDHLRWTRAARLGAALRQRAWRRACSTSWAVRSVSPPRISTRSPSPGLSLKERWGPGRPRSERRAHPAFHGWRGPRHLRPALGGRDRGRPDRTDVGGGGRRAPASRCSSRTPEICRARRTGCSSTPRSTH
jgi:hypothetical protein